MPRFDRQPPPPPLLPEWIPPTQSDNPSADDINGVGGSLSERILTVTPWGQYVPIIFGEDKTGAMLSCAIVQAGFLYLRLVWCVGEVGGIISVELADGTVPDGTVFTHYTGTSGQTADATLASVIPGYVDTFAGLGPDDIDLVYTVAKIPTDSLTEYPEFICHLKGLKMYSPVPKTQLTRMTTASESDSDTLVYVGNIITITDNSDGTIGQFIRYEEDELIDSDSYTFTIEVTAVSDMGSGNALVQWCGTPLIDTNTSLQMNINAIGTYTGTASFAPYDASNNFIRFDITGADVGVSLTYEVKIYNTDGNAVKSYSNIAGVALNHLFTDTQIGLGLTSDLVSYVDLINRNSSVLASGSFSESRSAIGLTLNKKAQMMAHLEVLRGYARCNVVNTGGVISYNSLKARPASFSLTAADLIPNTLKPVVKDARSIPNVVRVYYTDTYLENVGDPWKDNFVDVETPEVTSGAEYKREAVYKMPGFQSRTAAKRFALDRINERLRSFAVTFKSRESVYNAEEGETFNLLHELTGPVNHKMKLYSKKKINHAEWEILAEKESDTIYSDEIADFDPEFGIVTSDDPNTIIEASGLILTVETPEMQTGVYSSRLRAVWTATTYSYNHFYKIEYYEEDTDLLLDTQILNKNITTSVLGNVQENIEYRVELKVIGFGGTESTGINDNITPAGKDFPPSNVASFNVHSFMGLTTCNWSAAIDNQQVWYYEIQFGPTGFLWNDVNSRLVITRIDSYEYVTQSIPSGTWDFLIKAFDNAGNQSATAKRFQDIVIEDIPDLFQIASGAISIANAKSSGMSGFLSDRVTSILGFDAGFYSIKDYATKTGEDWSELHPNAMNTYTADPFLITGPGVSGSELKTDSIDAGQEIDGIWTIKNTVSESEILGLYTVSGGNMIEVLSGDAPIISIELSDNNTTWTTYTGQLSVSATARYMRLSIDSVNQTDSWIYRAGTYNYLIHAKIKTEYGSMAWNNSTNPFFYFERPTSDIQFVAISVADSTAYTPSHGYTSSGGLWTGLNIKLTDTTGAWTTNTVNINIIARYI